jgi:hypothetical protein
MVVVVVVVDRNTTQTTKNALASYFSKLCLRVQGYREHAKRK